MRESLYRYSKDELSLRVFNEYSLYQIRHEKRLIRELRKLYQFTNAQLFELKNDLVADLEETRRFNEKNGKNKL